VTVVPGANLGTYVNTAIGSGVSPFNETVTDLSDSGTDSDPTRSNPDEPGDTGGTDDPVPVDFPPIDLTVTKVADVASLPAEGGTVDWTLVVTNNGPGDDTGPITLVDRLPPELRYVAASGDGWDCTHDSPAVTCIWDAPLAAGADTTPVTVLTEVGDAERGTVVNGATVSSTGTETTTDNNDADAEVEILAGDDSSTPQGTLPRTGAAIGGLVLLGLGLIAGGRLLTGRRRRPGR
jgi:uncharacterized repeat protein (TIGR01451 family)